MNCWKHMKRKYGMDEKDNRGGIVINDTLKAEC